MTFDDQKTCTGCKRVLSVDLFSRCREGRQTRCKDCCKVVRQKRTQTVEFKLKIQAKNHGLTVEELGGIRWLQDNSCAVCGKADPTDLDHDHKCCDKAYGCGKCVRGLLCHKCNVILGWSNDSIQTLENCVKYLERVS